MIKKREDILRTMVTAPCWRPADNAHLWLWATNNHLLDALWLMDALGFRYVTNRAWGKCEEAVATGVVIEAGEWFRLQRPGLGQYFFGQHELLLFGVRGRLPARHKRAKDGYTPDTSDVGGALRKPRTLLLAPRGEHSEKPAQAYLDILHVSPGPRLEMFARDPRDGWDVWGNEVAHAIDCDMDADCTCGRREN